MTRLMQVCVLLATLAALGVPSASEAQCVEVTKEVNCAITHVGASVTYTIGVRNCGESFDLTSVEVHDDLLGGPLAGFP